jgi:short-subunit dehydrogenase
MTTSPTDPKVPPPRPRALVTGASSGLGAAFARGLAEAGHDLILVARRRDRLEALARELERDSGARCSVIAADLADPAQRGEVEERAAADEALAILVNNAGFAALRAFVELPADRIEEQIQLHILALVRLTRAVLPGMLARGRGTIINVSSATAFSASLPASGTPAGRAAYAASKAYVNTFSELLAGELAGTGVQVQALCVGPMRTEFFEAGGVDISQIPPDILMEPEAAVRAALAGLRLGEVLCFPGLEDASLIAQHQQIQTRLFTEMRRSAPASRYVTGPPL